MRVGIPFEIKDYAISGNASAKQSLLNYGGGEFYEDQEIIRNNDSIQNQIQQQTNSILQQDPIKLAFLDSLQSNLNSIMSQKNLQQQLQPQQKINSNEQSELYYKTIQKDNDDPNQSQFEQQFQQNIQKQLQNIKQIKTQGDNSHQAHQKQAFLSSTLSPQSQQQQNIQQNNIQIGNQGIIQNLPSSKSSVLQYQQYLSTMKLQQSSPSENSKYIDNLNTIQNKQSTHGSNGPNNSQLNNYMTKPIDFQEECNSNQLVQQNISSKNSANATPNSDNRKINQTYSSLQNQQENQYIPLSQQIQNQINNSRISEDAKQQQVAKEQNERIIQQQLIEQQKQKILKNYQDTLQKQQQKQQVQNHQQQKNTQDVQQQNTIRQKQQSMQQQISDTVVQISPGRRKTTEESNLSPKHVFLKLECHQQNNQQQDSDFNNQNLHTNQKYNVNNQIFSKNNLIGKRQDTDGSVKQNGSSYSQKQLQIIENNSNQQILHPKNQNYQNNGATGNYSSIPNQQTHENVNKQFNSDLKQTTLKKGSAYQSQRSLQLIQKMMEQKNFKDFEAPKDFENSQKEHDSRIIYESQAEQQSPEIKKKGQYLHNENENSLQDPNKKEKSFGREYSIENQRQSETISNFINGNSFQEDQKTELSIQSISKSQVNAMNINNFSKNGIIRNSQESLMKSLEERKKYTIAANNQKCIIFTKDQSKQQNCSFTTQNSQKKNQSNLKTTTVFGTSVYPGQEDLYYVNGSMESLQKQHNNPHLQNMSGQKLQSYYNQQLYEDQINQQQMIQQEDEEALQHQQYLREQDMLLQQQISQNGDIPLLHYESTTQGQFKSNVKQQMEHILQDQEASNRGQTISSDQNVIQSVQLQNSNHMTFGPNQRNNLKQQMQEQQNNTIQQQSNQLNCVNVNQMLQQQQNQTTGQINMDSYQMNIIQSPDNNHFQNQGISVYSSIENVQSQQYLQQNSRVRISSNISNCMKLNTSTETVNNISRISNKTGINYPNYNGNQGNGYHQMGVDHSGDVNLSKNINYQNKQNQSYVSQFSNNRDTLSQKKDDKNECSQVNVQLINKKELNWLNYTSFERNNIWMKLKQQNRQNLKQEQNEREQLECTFKPSLIASRKPGLMKQYSKPCIQQSRLPTTYSSNKKNMIKDYSVMSRIEGMGNSGYFINENQVVNTTINNNNISQNNSAYQYATGIKTNAQSNNITINSTMKQSDFQNNGYTAQNNADYAYQNLSLAQSPTSLHQEIKKAVSYTQINQLKKNISSTPNLLYNIPSYAPNSTQNKVYAQGSIKKQITYKQYKPNLLQ